MSGRTILIGVTVLTILAILFILFIPDKDLGYKRMIMVMTEPSSTEEMHLFITEERDTVDFHDPDISLFF